MTDSFNHRWLSAWPQSPVAGAVSQLLALGYVLHRGIIGDWLVTDGQGVSHWVATTTALVAFARQADADAI